MTSRFGSLLLIFVVTTMACDPCKNNDDSDEVQCLSLDRPLSYIPVDSNGNSIIDLLGIETYHITYYNKHNKPVTFFYYLNGETIDVNGVNQHDSIKIQYNDTLSSTFTFSDFVFKLKQAEECCPNTCYLDSFKTHVNDTFYVNSPSEVIVSL